MDVDGIVTAAVVGGESCECGLNGDCVLTSVDERVSLSDGSTAVITKSLIDSSSGTTGSTAVAFWDFGPHRRFLGSAAGMGLDSTDAGSANDEAGND